MYEKAIEILKRLNDNGYEAYIVGGYPRNHYLGFDSTDIDICTSAMPNDILSLFSNVDMSYSSYGVVRLIYGDFSYEVTTFRNDKTTLDGNRSYPVQFVNCLEDDLLRRDFVMNTLCINQHSQYVDYLGAIQDIDNKVIKTVKDSSISFREDPLRILRAIRFSVVLDFTLSEDICYALPTCCEYLSKLSFYQIKKELNLIFSSQNCMKGISYLKEFHMANYLGFSIDNVKFCSNYLGIWAQCTFNDCYPFSKKERHMIEKIRSVIYEEPSMMILYKYGYDICQFYDEIYGNSMYYNLNQTIPITKRSDICIDKNFLLSKVDSYLISSLYKKLEEEILNGNLINTEDQVKDYILKYIQDMK